VSGKDVVVRKDIGNTNDTVDWKKLSSKQDLFESGAVKRVKVGEDVGKIVTHWNPDKKAYFVKDEGQSEQRKGRQSGRREVAVMEVKVNREIRDYTEAMFFGLSLRQFIFSALACGVAVGIYLGLKPLLGVETTSWLCIVAAFPFAVLGFLKYNGMTAEKFIWAWIKSTLLIPKVLTFGNTNYYYEMLVPESKQNNGKPQCHRKGARQKKHSRRKGAKKR